MHDRKDTGFWFSICGQSLIQGCTYLQRYKIHTFILWISGANRNTNSSTVAMLLWNNLVRVCSSSSSRELLCWGPDPPRAEPEQEPGAPGEEPWFPTGWRKALLLLPPDQPWPRLGSWLHSWAASSSIQWSVWSSLVSATPSLSWWPVRGQKSRVNFECCLVRCWMGSMRYVILYIFNSRTTLLLLDLVDICFLSNGNI